MPFVWSMPVSWVTTFVTAGLCFLPALFGSLTLASPRSRSSPLKEAIQYEEGCLQWMSEQERRGQGGMFWMLDWEYYWGEQLLDKKGVRHDVSVPNLLGH